MCAYSILSLSLSLQYFDTVGWVLRPVKNCRPYNLYCVGGDVKPCSINQSIMIKKLAYVVFILLLSAWLELCHSWRTRDLTAVNSDLALAKSANDCYRSMLPMSCFCGSY